MEAKEGDIFKSTLDGAEYTVKKVVNSMVVLESEDGQRQILTGIENLSLFYKKKESIKA